MRKFTIVIQVLVILGLVAGCASWALFQTWMARTNPECGLRAGCCGGAHCKKDSDQDGHSSS